MCTGREEEYTNVKVGASLTLDEGIFVKQTTRRISESVNSIDRQTDRQTGESDRTGLRCSPHRDYCSGVRSEALRYDRAIIGIMIVKRGTRTADRLSQLESAVHLHLMPC